MPEPLLIPFGYRLKPEYRNGLVGHWKMNVNGGVLLPDLSGYNNHGTLTNFSNPPTATSGWGGQGVILDGVNDFIDILDPVLGSTAMSVCAWVKKTAYMQYQGIVTDYQSVAPYRNWLLGYENPENTLFFYVGDGTNTNSQLITGFTANIWHFVCGVFDVNQDLLRIYLDNNYQSKTTTINNIGSTLAPAGYHAIGKYNGTYEFKGLIDDVRIYNRALSADEVAHSCFQQEDEWDLGMDDDLATIQGIPIELMRGGIK